MASPIAVREALACEAPLTHPPGLTNEVPMSVETPVIYCPFETTARDPRVSVRESMRPPWTTESHKAQGSAVEK